MATPPTSIACSSSRIQRSCISTRTPRTAPAPSASEAEPVIDLDSTDEHPILVLDERDEMPDESAIESIVLETVEPAAAPLPPPAPPTPPAPPAPPAPPRAATSGHTAPRILIPDEMRKRLAAEAEARAAAAAAFETDDESPGLLSQRWPWVAGVAALAFLLLLQVVHSQRNALVREPGPRARGGGCLCVSRPLGHGADGPFGL